MSKENKPWSADMQAAMKELEKFYRISKSDEELHYCPLCYASITACKDCCWTVITGRSCMMSNRYYHPAELKHRTKIRLRRQRARELKQWMKHYEEER
jgi:hypothetical protein